MAKSNNLKPWQPGESGNPKGRPKGARSVKRVIVDLLNDPKTYKLLPHNALRNTKTPLEAIICMLLVKSIRGDVRAAEVLLRYSIDKEELAEAGGFFNQSELVVKVIGSDGNPYLDSAMPVVIDEKTGQLVE